MNETDRRRELAARVAEAVAPFAPAAVFLVGSAAEGLADADSDIDLIQYYDRLPDPEAFRAALRSAGAERLGPLGAGEEFFADRYRIEGVELQTGATLTARIEQLLVEVRRGDHLGSPMSKPVSGLLHARPLAGAERLVAWQAVAADYPDELQRKAIAHHSRFFPIWELDAALAARDATLFRVQARLEVAFNVLGVLCALNRTYFTDFQLKRMRALLAGMEVKPARVAERLEAVFDLADAAALADLRGLVEETKGLASGRPVPSS